MKRRSLLALAVLCLPLPARADPATAACTPPAVDPAQATREFAALRERAVGGDAQAQYDLAVALDCGRRVKRDRKSAAIWLKRAADQGHTGAQAALGWKLMTGRGVARDDAAAFGWLRRAAEAGNTSAQNNLGILYAQGRGTARDPDAAAKWFGLAAEKGAADAQRNLEALRAGRGKRMRPGSAPAPSQI